MPHSVPPEIRTHEASRLPSISMRQMGVLVLFVSMTVLFTATIIAFWFTRLTSEHYREPGLPDLPTGLVASTVLIAINSLTILQAQRAVKQNRLETLERRLWLATGFSTAFLLMQALNWFEMRPPSDANSLYLSTFFMLTGVHALHVIGGFVPLGFVLHHAHKRHYTSSNHEGLSLCAQYWHYLGAVWLVLVTMLYFGNR